MGRRRMTGTCSRFSIAAVCVFVLAGASTAETQAPSPLPIAASSQGGADAAQRPSKDWKRVRSGDLEVVGDASIDQMKAAVVSLTAFRTALVTKFPGLRLTSPVSTVIVLFKNAGAFSPYVPRDDKGHRVENIGGYFTAQGDCNYIVLPAPQETGSASLAPIYHEYVHFVMSRNAIEMPAWLNEGLADFYSTFVYDSQKRRGTVGLPPPSRVELLRQRGFLPLDQMLGRDSATKLIRNPATIGTFYSQSWAMVHYLLLARPAGQRDAIQQYLAAIKGGATIEDAFRRAFDTTFAGLTKELETYVAQPNFPGFYVDVPPSAASDQQVEAMSEADSLFIRGDLLARLGADSEAEKMLEKLFALQSGHVRGRVALGVIRAHQMRFTDALDVVGPIAGSDAGDFRASLVVGNLPFGLDHFEEALTAYRRATKLNAASTAGWQGRCLSATAAGLEAESDEAMRYLQALEPTPLWYYIRAREAFHHGRFDAAIRDARAYLEKAGLGQESAPYAAFVGAIACWHLGQPEEASRLLATVRPVLSAGS